VLLHCMPATGQESTFKVGAKWRDARIRLDKQRRPTVCSGVDEYSDSPERRLILRQVFDNE